ncbi:hypothetical protein HXX76_010689 [Chlamydomonas incerta]|uniref:Uncharacterized protein n=1 Tax=Chlamydomonas incerta TaxID=51695 RepID=A0A835SMV2_CHLIN|nr:hypothetical protein HXX76_010689 [Chlamydomonas incerta]|eukprot:KAG2429909.1 hypothetical protein HXX76_010689 [Chlamydomonas incerta]
MLREPQQGRPQPELGSAALPSAPTTAAINGGAGVFAALPPPLQLLQLLLLAAPLVLYAALFVSREHRTRRALVALRDGNAGPRSASAAEPSGGVDVGGAGAGSSQAAAAAAPAARANASARPAGGADGGGAVTAAVAVGHADGGSDGEDGYAQEPELLRWRRFDPCTYMPGLPLRWRLLLGLFRHFVVCRPSNDASLGLQGWREGRLARWDLAFPVLTVFDRPSQAVPGEGFHEWPLFDIFKIPLSGLGGSWHQYLSRGLSHDERRRVRQRTRLYASFESRGLLHCEVVGLGPRQPQQQEQEEEEQQEKTSPPPPAAATAATGAAATAADDGGDDAVARALRPPRVSGGAPGSAAARALVSELWALYEATGRRNGFTEVTRQQFTQLLEEAPGVQVIVIREGSRHTCATPAAAGTTSASAASATSAPSPTSPSPPAPAPPTPPAPPDPPTRPGRMLAFAGVLPQRDSLQLLYAGQEYGSPLVRESNAYFQTAFVALQLALDHNSSCSSGSSSSSSSSSSCCYCDAKGAEAAEVAAAAAGHVSPFFPAHVPPPLQLQPFAWLDLGPGHRFVKTHLGAAPHPLVLYARGIGPLTHMLAGRLLGAHLDARKLLTDP